MVNTWSRSVASAVDSAPVAGARRMAESAALLVDEVLPEAPMRQWVQQGLVRSDARKQPEPWFQASYMVQYSSRSSLDHVDNGLSSPNINPPIPWLFIEYRVYTSYTLLLAVGRVPNTDDLGLENAGIESSQFGMINVDDHLRTNVAGVWALGDVNGRGAFTHTSYNDYEIVVANLFDDDPRKVSDRILCYGLFIDPPLG
jgi:hypothetical protein